MPVQVLDKKNDINSKLLFEDGPKPFLFNFAEPVEIRPPKHPDSSEIFDDPSTTQVTRMDVEDMHSMPNE